MDENSLIVHRVRAENSGATHYDDKKTIWTSGDINNTPEFYLKPIHFLYMLIGALLIFAGGFLTNYFWLLGSH